MKTLLSLESFKLAAGMIIGINVIVWSLMTPVVIREFLKGEPLTRFETSETSETLMFSGLITLALFFIAMIAFLFVVREKV